MRFEKPWVCRVNSCCVICLHVFVGFDDNKEIHGLSEKGRLTDHPEKKND